MMSQSIKFLFQTVLLLFISSANSQTLPQLNFVNGLCLPKGEGINISSTYSNNIEAVLSNLTSVSSTAKFSHFSTGDGPDLVSGVFLCRPDISSEGCRECVMAAVGVTRLSCTNHVEAITWYQECMLRYSNHTLLATEETKPYAWSNSLLNVSRPDLFPGLLKQTLEGIITEAAAASNPLRFAVVKKNFTLFEGLYGLALCTPDITPLECQHCLRNATDIIPICCGGYPSGQWFSYPLVTCAMIPPRL